MNWKEVILKDGKWQKEKKGIGGFNKWNFCGELCHCEAFSCSKFDVFIFKSCVEMHRGSSELHHKNPIFFLVRFMINLTYF